MNSNQIPGYNPDNLQPLPDPATVVPEKLSPLQLVEELRSGRWKKGTGRLRCDGRDSYGEYGSKYCCLGVAAEVAGLEYDPSGGTLHYSSEIPWLSSELQGQLASVNDNTNGFDAVIKLLVAYDTGPHDEDHMSRICNLAYELKHEDA